MFDLDGTLVLGDRTGKSYDVLPGAVEVLTRLRERGIPYVVLTNGSAYPAAVQAPRLRAVGLPGRRRADADAVQRHGRGARRVRASGAR